MKRKRNAEEILISSDSEREEQADTDWEEEENEDNDGDDDDDEEEEEEDVDDNEDDDDNDEDDYDDDDSAYDDDDDDDDDDKDWDAYDDDEEEDDNDNVKNALRCMSERVPARKAQKRAFSEFNGNRDVESSKEGKKKTRHKKRRKKGAGHAVNEEDQKLFLEALNIIRGGDLEKLKLEHCKAYLRRYSLRLTGSKTTLLDRVQEHFELKAYGGGMAKYPQSTFTINCTGDACTGDVVLFKQKVKNYKKAGKSSTKPSWGRRIVAGRIVKESYGSDKQQHTFTVEVLWSRGPKQLPLLYPLLIKGRNLYRLATYRQRWPNEEERKRVLQEKHSRGDVARNAREDRVSSKRHSCSNRTRLSNKKARVTSKREQRSVNFSQVNTNAGKPGSFRGKAWSDSQSKGTTFREGSMNSRVVSSHREYENRFCEMFGTTKCTLSIKACFAGLLIGSKGRNIGAISRASGARLEICEDRLNPTSRLVEIIGEPEQVQIATGMVMQSFLDRGLPPPVVMMRPMM